MSLRAELLCVVLLSYFYVTATTETHIFCNVLSPQLNCVGFNKAIALYNITYGNLDPGVNCSDNQTELPTTKYSPTWYRNQINRLSGLASRILEQPPADLDTSIGFFISATLDCVNGSTISEICKESDLTGNQLYVWSNGYNTAYDFRHNHSDCNCSIISTSRTVIIHTYDINVTHNQSLTLEYENGSIAKGWSYSDPYQRKETISVTPNENMILTWHNEHTTFTLRNGVTLGNEKFWIGIEGSNGSISLRCHEWLTPTPSAMHTTTTTTTSTTIASKTETNATTTTTTTENTNYTNNITAATTADTTKTSPTFVNTNTSTINSPTAIITTILSSTTSNTTRTETTATNTNTTSSSQNNNNNTANNTNTNNTPLNATTSTKASAMQQNNTPGTKVDAFPWWIILIACIAAILIIIASVCIAKKKKRNQQVHPNGEHRPNDNIQEDVDETISHQTDTQNGDLNPRGDTCIGSLPPIIPEHPLHHQNPKFTAIKDDSAFIGLGSSHVPSMPPIQTFHMGSENKQNSDNAYLDTHKQEHDGDEATIDEDADASLERKKKKKRRKKRKKRKHREDAEANELDANVDENGEFTADYSDLLT